MDKDRFAELEARLGAEAEEFEERVMEALKTGKRSARILYTAPNEPTGKEWAVVDVFGSSRGGVHSIAMPEEKAEQYAEIINDAHRHVDVILDAFIHDEPKRALDHVRRLFSTLKKARRVGRPRFVAGATKAEQVTRYLEQHGLEKTIKELGYPVETVVRYQRRATERGQ